MKGQHPSALLAAFLLVTAQCASTSAAYADELLNIFRLAQDNDPVFLSAQASQQTALETIPQSRALLLPTLSLNASTTNNRQEILSSSSTLFPSKTFNYTTNGYSLSLTQPLFHRDYFARLGQADAQAGQANAEFAAAEQNLIIRVAQRYFDVLSAIDNLVFAQAEKVATERQLEQTRQRFDVGLIAITDVHETQAEHDLITAQEIEAENLLANQYEALRELTNNVHDSLNMLGDNMPLIAPDPADIKQWSETALLQNLSLLAAKFSLRVAHKAIVISRSNHYPNFDLTANYNYSDISGGSFGGRESADSNIALQMTLPLYQGGAINSQVREARLQYKQAQQALEQQRRATLRQTRDAYRNVTSAINRVKALKQAVISANSALRATEAGLEVGTRTAVDVLNVRRNQFRAQRDYARSRYDYVLSTLTLKQAAGLLTITDLQQINNWLEQSTPSQQPPSLPTSLLKPKS